MRMPTPSLPDSDPGHRKKGAKSGHRYFNYALLNDTSDAVMYDRLRAVLKDQPARPEGEELAASPPSRVGKGASEDRAPGHPRCTSAEDCIGEPSAKLVQHVLPDDGGKGDIYCLTCWNCFLQENIELECTYEGIAPP